MILGFKKTFDNGEQTYFREKIIASYFLGLINRVKYFDNMPIAKIINEYKRTPKIHTIRHGSRWKAGDKIHFATGVRTKHYECFAEGYCHGVQDIIIKWEYGGYYPGLILKITIPRSEVFGESQYHKLYKNDGLTEWEFHDWFCKGKKGKFEGQIIHWTDFRY